MQGFYQSLQRAKARNPYFTKDLPDKLDFWGRSKTQGEGRRDEMFNPMRIQTGEYNALDQELIRLSETGIGVFDFHRDRIDGLKLNNEQYNNFVRLINEVDDEGKVLGELGFDPEETLLNALKYQVTDTEADYYNLPTDEDRFKELKGILSDRRAKARQRLLKVDAELGARHFMMQD
jgi:hypothetical protein